MVDGSTWGRAGRLFFRMIVLTFLSAGAATSLLVVVRAKEVSFVSVSKGAIVGGVSVSTLAILFVVKMFWKF